MNISFDFFRCAYLQKTATNIHYSKFKIQNSTRPNRLIIKYISTYSIAEVVCFTDFLSEFFKNPDRRNHMALKFCYKYIVCPKVNGLFGLHEHIFLLIHTINHCFLIVFPLVMVVLSLPKFQNQYRTLHIVYTRLIST